jgi:hypothetical protein
MPTMPRPNKKATKIAFDLLGTPPSFKQKQNALQKKINQRLLFDETQRVR